MARNKVDCKWVPEVPGTKELSNLYIELGKLINNRSLTNFIYVSYLQSGVATQMDRQGKVRNKQGQHRAKDVYDFFDVSSAKNLLDIKAQLKSEGFTDSSGNLVDFAAIDAYQKAKAFNNSNKYRVASVVQNGDKFNILIDDKDSRTQYKQAEVNKAIEQWEALTSGLSNYGINIDDLRKINPGLVNPGAVFNFLRILNIYNSMPNDALSIKDIQMLLTLNPNAPLVKNILNRGWGTVEETAQRIYNTIHSSTSTPEMTRFINNVLYETKKLSGINISAIETSIADATATFESLNESTHIQKELKKLDIKYHIENEVFVRDSKLINKYSEAAADAIMSLERQIRNLEQKIGRTSQSEELRRLQHHLLKELESKKYAGGLLSFMNDAVKYLSQVNTLINNTSFTGNDLEYAFTLADVTTKAVNLKDAYYNIINSVASSELLNDFGISDTDKQTLKNLAINLKSLFDAQESKTKELQKEAMFSLGKVFIGEHNSLYGKDLADIVNMKEADTTMMDYFYSIGRSSSTVISILGALTRDQQMLRDAQLSKIALRIRRLNHILSKDKKDSSFMYDSKGRIVSQYDWDAYYAAKSAYAANLKLFGFKTGSFEFEEEMQKWDDANTTEVEVDAISHRTERMPNFYLPIDFREGWSDAQNRYYDEMMQLKGEIGTLLPSYAQHQYLAPQKRIKWDQVLKEGLTGKRSFSSMFKWFMEDAKFWKMKQGENKFLKQAMFIDGEESLATPSTYDNTILRKIPIFYMTRLEEGDLSRDFSSAIQALASTALNYNVMNNMKDLARLMTDYVSENTPIEQNRNGVKRVDLNESGVNKVVTGLRKVVEDSNCAAMMNGFVLKHLYGVENKDEGTEALLCAKLIGYTSVKGLAVNVKGALTNKYVGVLQTIIRAFGGQYYDIKDLLKAEAILLGAQGATTAGALTGGAIGGLAGAAIGAGIGTAIGAVGMTGKLVDILTNNRNSKDTLISEFFDSSQNNFSELSDTGYHNTLFGRLYGSFEPMAMYQRGEHWIHMLNVYAVLQHEKVVQLNPDTGERKIISLYEALKKGKKIDGNTELIIKDNIYTINGKKLDISSDYFDALKRRIRYINQQCHGSMNKEDKGLIHQYMLGKLTMNFRQWMVEHHSSRWRQLHWDESIRDVNMSNFYHNTKVKLNNKKVKLIDALEMVDNGTGDGEFHYEIKAGATTLDGTALTDSKIDNMLNKYAEDAGWRRGFKTDFFKILRDYVKERKEYETKATIYWDNLSETQKADVKQVLGESLVWLSLASLSFCMGDPDKHRGEFFYRMWMYVVRKCLFDENASYLPGLAFDATTLLKRPVPSSQSIISFLYPIAGLVPNMDGTWDVTKKVQKGQYKGMSVYEKNFIKYTVPFYSQILQTIDLAENDDLFETLSNQITR